MHIRDEISQSGLVTSQRRPEAVLNPSNDLVICTLDAEPFICISVCCGVFPGFAYFSSQKPAFGCVYPSERAKNTVFYGFR